MKKLLSIILLFSVMLMSCEKSIEINPTDVQVELESTLLELTDSPEYAAIHAYLNKTKVEDLGLVFNKKMSNNSMSSWLEDYNLIVGDTLEIYVATGLSDYVKLCLKIRTNSTELKFFLDNTSNSVKCNVTDGNILEVRYNEKLNIIYSK